MGNESKLSDQFAGLAVSSFHIKLSRQQERNPFTLGTRTYKNRADFDAHIKNECFARGLPLFDIVRANNEKITIRYHRPTNYLPLLHIAFGNLKGEYTIRLLMHEDKTHHAEFYRAQLQDYCELCDIKGIFIIEDNAERNIIKGVVTGLANACHLRQIHLNGTVMSHVEDMDNDHYIERRVVPLQLPPPIIAHEVLPKRITYQPGQDNI